MKSITTYLTFNGQCEEAFLFYQSIFNGDLEYMGRYKDLSEEARQHFPHCSDEHIMHATLRLGKDIVLMGSDIIDPVNPKLKNNFALYITAETKDEADQIFNEIAIEGDIIVPLDIQFWDGYYGLCIDKFGIKWKVGWSDPAL